MPKITSYTPAWLANPSKAHNLFTAKTSNSTNGFNLSSLSHNESSKLEQKPGPRRTVARRGTEVFIAVGREIRWADLVYLKEKWEEAEEERTTRDGKHQNGDSEEEHAQGYRTIKTPVADDIKQLIISPHGNFLAILTTHTVHIAVLPDPSHLTARDTSPLRLKTYTLGPVTHVTTQSAVASALWHPLGVNGSCLVTVTEDAIVRVWELTTTDRLSFDRPTLAIDLKKLADGTSLDQDFSASVSGMNKSFSPDSFEMEVASATFGSRGSGGWSSMTLWIAMREGDVYALCPLLPERWSPPPMLIPSLSVSIVAKVASIEDDKDVPEQTKLLGHQQLAWMADLDVQDPSIVEGLDGESGVEVYSRPQHPGKIPKLQGPFDIEPPLDESEDEMDAILSDIYVVGSKLDTDALMSEEDEDILIDDSEQGGLSCGIICLLSGSGRVTICLDLDGVEAQWLPKTKSKQRRFAEVQDPPSLLSFQIMDTLRAEEIYVQNWPMFSPDPTSRYSFFVTNMDSVSFISLAPWVFRLESELQASSEAGIDFRLDLIVQGPNSVRERILTEDFSDEDPPPQLAASTILRDPDLGYFLVTTSSRGPVSLNFETPEVDDDIRRSRSRSPALRSPTFDEFEGESEPPLLIAPRPVYQPSHTFSSLSSLPSLMYDLERGKYKRIIHEPIRLSPATLTILTDAHKILSEETYRLGTAAAELFRKCETLQIELKEQISRTTDIARRIDSVTGDDVDFEDDVPGGNEGIEQRIQDARTRQTELMERLNKLRKRLGRGTGKPLSDKEKAWSGELSRLVRDVLPEKEGDDLENSTDDVPTSVLWQRFEEVQKIKEDILHQVSETTKDGKENQNLDVDVKVPSEIRRVKVAHVMSLLERESALVEGTKNRLERLSLS